jgi:hypothetical protein
MRFHSLQRTTPALREPPTLASPPTHPPLAPPPAGWLAAPAFAGCRDQLDTILGPGYANVSAFIDVDTPDSACTIQRCASPYSDCQVNKGVPAGPTTDYVLVFSDEFSADGRDLSVAGRDPKWTAEDMYYYPTQDMEVYKPEQVQTRGGDAVITFVRKPDGGNFTAMSQNCQPNCTVWEIERPFKSGFVTGWNKFCFTGGYMEMSVMLPGGDVGHYYPGYWPAFWSMGNLGRAGYQISTNGLWPYSYDRCGGGSSKNETPWSTLPGQLLSACPDPPGRDRSRWGLMEGKGRNAPEFDVFEIL